MSDYVPSYPEALPTVDRLKTRIAALERQIVAARKWYDEENPPEHDGADRVYPWDAYT